MFKYASNLFTRASNLVRTATDNIHDFSRDVVNMRWGAIAGRRDVNLLARRSDIILELRERAHLWSPSLPDLIHLLSTPEGNYIKYLILELLFIQEYMRNSISIRHLENGRLPQDTINNYDENGVHRLNDGSYLYIMLHLIFDDDIGIDSLTGIKTTDNDIDLTKGFTRVSMREIKEIVEGYILRDIDRNQIE